MAGLVIGVFLLASRSGFRGAEPPSPRHPEFGQDRYASATSASGLEVSLADFSGRYVWVDYAAEWCAACVPQSRAIRSLDQARSGVVFVTVMSSEPQGYGHPATRATAARWASRLSLDPDRVLAADFTAMTLPQLALFSPEGREVFRHTGQLSAVDIRQRIQQVR